MVVVVMVRGRGCLWGRGQEVRRGAGGTEVVERCEGLSQGGLGTVSRGASIRRDKIDEMREGETQRVRDGER